MKRNMFKYGLFATSIINLFSNLFALDRINNLANNFCIYLDLDLKILPKKQLIHRQFLRILSKF